MPEYGSWKAFREKMVTLLEKRTGEGLAVWNARVAKQKPKDEAALRKWLAGQGVEGYPRDLLVREHFGYPDFLTASAGELIDGQYKARVQASKDRVHVALRFDGRKPSGRLRPSKIHDTMPLELAFAAPADVDAEAIALFRDAWKENA